MKRKGLNLLGKIVVATFFQICLIGNISAQETGVLDMEVGDYGIISSALDFNGATTIEFWTRGIGDAENTTSAVVWASKSTSGGIMIYHNGEDGNYCIEWGSLKKWLHPGNREANTWMHIAFVFDAKGGLALYRDGEYRAGYIPTAAEEFTLAHAGSNPVWIGDYEWWTGDWWTTRNPNGARHAFADFRVWRTARTADEIAACYQTVMPEGTPNMVLNYTFMTPGETVTNVANSSTFSGILQNNGPAYTWGKVGVTPTNLVATDQTTGNFTLTWDGGMEGEWAVELIDASWESHVDTTTTNSFTVAGLEEGTYKVSVRAIWPLASATSDEINVVIGASGVAQQSIYNAMIINENGVLTLKNLEGNNDICVYNVAGTLLYQSKSADANYSIDATSWGAGVYFVNVKNGLKTQNFKIVL